MTFYNRETTIWLEKYLEEREDEDSRLFLISDRQWRRIWAKTSKSKGIKITAKVLRKWHSTMLGELMVPDRYVDIFQGRAPRSVLAKHYTGNGLRRLRTIYEKADLRILD